MGVLPLARREPWTEADLDDLDETYGYEIVDGRLLVSPKPAFGHALAVDALAAALRAVVPAGCAVVAEMLVGLPTSSRVTDLLVVDRAMVSRGDVRVRPEAIRLAVEVVSPSSVGDDRIRKPAEYAAAGIAAYWLVEPGEPPLITAFVLDGCSTTYRTASGASPRAELPYPVDLGS